jgi:hypothetical protein
VDDEVDQPVGVEVRDPDGARGALRVEVLHGVPLTVDVAVRLVNQVEVDVVEPEALKRRLERAPGVVPGGAVLDPELGGDEQLVTRDAAGGDGSTEGLLVLVGGCGVEVAVADLETARLGSYRLD